MISAIWMKKVKNQNKNKNKTKLFKEEKSFTKIVQPAVGQKRFCKKFIPAVAEQKCFSLHMKLSFIKWVKPEVEHEKIMQKKFDFSGWRKTLNKQDFLKSGT